MNNNIDIFKQAILEGVSQKIDETIKAYDGKIIYSKKHLATMRSILRGKEQRYLSAKAKRIIIIVAIIALLLISCTVIYREKIGELTINIFNRDDIITHEAGEDKPKNIEEVYELTYIPDGYILENTLFLPNIFQYTYYGTDGAEMIFQQKSFGNSIHHFDNEHGESDTINIGDLTVYCRRSAEDYLYIWDDEKYILTLTINSQISTEELKQIVEGIKIK